MRFLVDECTGNAVANWLRKEGHDVVSVYQEARGISDDAVIKKAFSENRILITNDKDFKDIKSKGGIYNAHKVGVIFFKFKKNEYSYWGIVKVFINQFDTLKEILLEQSPPFVYEISSQGVKRYDFYSFLNF